MILILSMVMAFAVFLILLPSCFLSPPLRQKGLQDRIYRDRTEPEAGFSDDHSQKRLGWLLYMLRNQERKDKLCKWSGFDQHTVRRSLQRLQWRITVEEFLLAKLVGGGLLSLTTFFLLWLKWIGAEIGTVELLLVVFTLVVFLLPTKLIEWADKRAKEEMHSQIPVFFSIVQVLLEAGMPVHTAIMASARKYHGRLGREFARLELEGKRYGNWRRALEEMSYLWDIDSLVSIISEINEAFTKGVAIADLLAVQVEDQVRQQEDEGADYVNRLSVKLLPFLIVFMGIPLMFLVLGPSLMSIKSQF